VSLHLDQRIGHVIEIGVRDFPESRQSDVVHGRSLWSLNIR